MYMARTSEERGRRVVWTSRVEGSGRRRAIKWMDEGEKKLKWYGTNDTIGILHTRNQPTSKAIQS